MPHFTSYDNAELHYRVLGPEGSGLPPLMCLAGGPGRDATYLDDLGGLAERRQLLIPDSRGTGASPPAADPSRYAFPHLAEDLEAFRLHLGLDRFALLAHDAGAATAQAYAAAYPDRLTRLVLISPGSRLQGEFPDDVRDIFTSRSAEPWWPEASAAVQTLSETPAPAEVHHLLLSAAPLAYGRWEAPQQAHAAAEPDQLHPVPRTAFWQTVDEPARQTLLTGLREVTCPVLVMTGGRDAVTGVRAGELVAASFPDGRTHHLPEAGHYPWIDEPARFRQAVEEFLHTA
ncbi:alpha/beta fold hydrolase [Streptomyces monomycini]|uniref:alpha/beta fold hydrolase n=1 Tax=Streptomyces monomycini TaxID=371720 RepID=UPI0004AAFA9B|nr:alpha/beta hydrolase [Streptomyces monomycini]